MSEMGLKLPCSYVEVESEEMEYVDGGGAIWDSIMMTSGGICTILTAPVIAVAVQKETGSDMAGVCVGMVTLVIGGKMEFNGTVSLLRSVLAKLF